MAVLLVKAAPVKCLSCMNKDEHDNQDAGDDLVFLLKMLPTNWFQSLNDSPHYLRLVTGNLITIFTLFVMIFCESVLCFCVVFQTPNKRIEHWQAWPIINIFYSFKVSLTSHNPS